VGKELVARQIHELSRRRNGPFVAINCAALVETLLEAELFGIEERTATGVRGRRGKFEHADGGTLFLDEVSDLSLFARVRRSHFAACELWLATCFHAAFCRRKVSVVMIVLA
jgi:transcriptional regulator with PAS, ATPase and Fis domain